MNTENSKIQNKHIAESNINRFLNSTTTEYFNAGRYHERAVKAFKYMPDYGKGVCNAKS